MTYIQKSILSKLKTLTIILFCCITYSAHGIDPTISARYPSTLINDDHNILTEAELADESYGTASAWKCYRTNSITISYRVMEYTKEYGENAADLNINVIDENGVINQYGMRRGLGVTYCKKISKIWEKLMTNQEYVCINGNLAGSTNEFYNGKTQQPIGWVFNKLKTNNGCDNYFASRDCTGKEIPVVFR